MVDYDRPLTIEERDAKRIHTAIDKIGEDVKKYLLDSTQFVLGISEEFIRKYGEKPEYKDFLTVSNLTALIISSINNGIADLGILCKSHAAHDPIRVLKGENLVAQRLPTGPAPPQSPTRMPLTSAEPPPPGPNSRKRRRMFPGGPNKGGGNRTRRRNRR